MTGPAVSAGAGVWCCSNSNLLFPTKIWSHSRYCLVVPDNLQGNLCQKSRKTQSSRNNALVQQPRRREGAGKGQETEESKSLSGHRRKHCFVRLVFRSLQSTFVLH